MMYSSFRAAPEGKVRLDPWSPLLRCAWMRFRRSESHSEEPDIRRTPDPTWPLLIPSTLRASPCARPFRTAIFGIAHLRIDTHFEFDSAAEQPQQVGKAV